MLDGRDGENYVLTCWQESVHEVYDAATWWLVKDIFLGVKKHSYHSSVIYMECGFYLGCCHFFFYHVIAHDSTVSTASFRPLPTRFLFMIQTDPRSFGPFSHGAIYWKKKSWQNVGQLRPCFSKTQKWNSFKKLLPVRPFETVIHQWVNTVLRRLHWTLPMIFPSRLAEGQLLGCVGH